VEIVIIIHLKHSSNVDIKYQIYILNNKQLIIIMIQVKVRSGEPVDRALKRLKKKLKDEAVLDSVRQRRYFTPKSETRKKKKQNAYYAQLMKEYNNQ